MILVCGASGFVGRALLPVLRDAGPGTPASAGRGGPPVRAMVRREFDAVRLRDEGYEVVTADLLTGHGVDAAVRGVETLVYLVHTLDAPGDVVANDLEAFQNLMLAARGAGVRRVVFLGSVAASEEATCRYLIARWAVELAVRQSGLRWVIVRAPWIVGPAWRRHPGTPFQLLRRLAQRPVVPLFAWRRSPAEPVALADVVEALTMAATDHDLDDRSFDLCGPDRLPLGEAMRELARPGGSHRVHLPLPGSGERLLGLDAWLLGRLPQRRTRLLLQVLREPQVCTDPSRRFPLPHRPLSYRQALEALEEPEAMRR